MAAHIFGKRVTELAATPRVDQAAGLLQRIPERLRRTKDRLCCIRGHSEGLPQVRDQLLSEVGGKSSRTSMSGSWFDSGRAAGHAALRLAQVMPAFPARRQGRPRARRHERALGPRSCWVLQLLAGCIVIPLTAPLEKTSRRSRVCPRGSFLRTPTRLATRPWKPHWAPVRLDLRLQRTPPRLPACLVLSPVPSGPGGHGRRPRSGFRGRSGRRWSKRP